MEERHRHRATGGYHRFGYFGCVATAPKGRFARCIPETHRGYTAEHRCSCGMIRLENHNAGKVERGPWFRAR